MRTSYLWYGADVSEISVSEAAQRLGSVSSACVRSPPQGAASAAPRATRGRSTPPRSTPHEGRSPRAAALGSLCLGSSAAARGPGRRDRASSLRACSRRRPLRTLCGTPAGRACRARGCPLVLRPSGCPGADRTRRPGRARRRGSRRPPSRESRRRRARRVLRPRAGRLEDRARTRSAPRRGSRGEPEATHPRALWPFREGERIAPRAFIAADLIDDGDERSVRAGRALLARREPE